jgi:hypothetical protein
MHEPRLSAAAAEEWIHHAESILRGVGHALNNRAAALGAIVELSGADDVAETRELAQGEVRRLSELARALLFIGDRGGGVQAFAPADAAHEARALLELHRDFREGVPAMDAARGGPVRTRRDTFVRALVALASRVPREPVATPPTLTIATEDDWVVAQLSGDGGAVTPLVAELARAMDGEPLSPPRYGFRVPSLKAIRRREGR